MINDKIKDVKVARYLNPETKRTYWLLTLYNEFTGTIHVKVTEKKAKELIAFGVKKR